MSNDVRVVQGDDEAVLAARRRVDRLATLAFVVYWLAWSLLLAFTWTRYPNPHHGDYLSDVNALFAGQSYDQHGLARFAGMPVYRVNGLPQQKDDAYTHYPPGPMWILQGWKQLGLRELWQLRAAAVGTSALAALLVFLACKRMTGSAVIAGLAGFFYTCNAAFAGYADSLHQHAYMQLTLWAALLAWLICEQARTRGRRGIALTICVVAFFVDGWLTFEHLLFIPIFVGGRFLILRERRLWPAALMVCAFPLVIVGSRLAHNAVFYGSLERAIDDFRSAAEYRSGSSVPSATLAALRAPLGKRLGWIDIPATDFYAEFRVPVLGPACLAALAALVAIWLCTCHLRRLSAGNLALLNGLLLLAAGGAWFVAMREHAARHPHLIMELLPGLALLLAGLTYFGFAQATRHVGFAPVRVAGPIAGLAMMALFALQMRQSQTLNFVGNLDAGVHEQVARRRGTLERAAQAGSAFPPGWSIYLAGPYPEMAWMAGRPSRYSDTKRPPGDANEVVWIEAWTAADGPRIVGSVAEHPFPARLSPPAAYTHVLSPAMPDWWPAQIRFGDRMRVTAMDCRQTLDGQSVVLSLLADGALDSDALKQLISSCETISATGETRARSEIRLVYVLKDDRHLLVQHVIPSYRAGARFRLALWSDSLNANVAPTIEQQPNGVELALEGSALLISASPRPAIEAGGPPGGPAATPGRGASVAIDPVGGQ